MTLFVPTVPVVEALHEDRILRYGGSEGIRDHNLLASALSRVEQKLHYEPATTVQQAAASLAFGLIKNHAFIDGNKRIGLAAMVMMLRYNGFILHVSQAEQIRVVQRVAASQMDEAEWTAWVERFVEPV